MRSLTPILLVGLQLLLEACCAEPSNMRIALCTIVRDNESIKVDWLGHHLINGVDHIYVYMANNETTTTTTTTADQKQFFDAGFVTLAEAGLKNSFLEISESHIYQDCFSRAEKAGIKIAVPLDLDEFIIPPAGSLSIQAATQCAFEHNPDLIQLRIPLFAVPKQPQDQIHQGIASKSVCAFAHAKITKQFIRLGTKSTISCAASTSCHQLKKTSGPLSSAGAMPGERFSMQRGLIILHMATSATSSSDDGNELVVKRKKNSQLTSTISHDALAHDTCLWPISAHNNKRMADLDRETFKRNQANNATLIRTYQRLRTMPLQYYLHDKNRAFDACRNHHSLSFLDDATTDKSSHKAAAAAAAADNHLPACLLRWKARQEKQKEDQQRKHFEVPCRSPYHHSATAALSKGAEARHRDIDTAHLAESAHLTSRSRPQQVQSGEEKRRRDSSRPSPNERKERIKRSKQLQANALLMYQSMATHNSIPDTEAS